MDQPYEAWRKAVKAGEAPAPTVRVFKQFAVDVEPMDDRRVRFVITTSTPDRERDVVSADGIDVTAYATNAVVLFAHDYRALPIGRAIQIERHSDRLVATVEFATAELNPLAEQVFRMVKAGFLKGASIGFRPLEWAYDEERRGVNFQKVELLEFSIVPVPANAEALIAASAAGVDVAVLKDWAEQTLARVRGAEALARLPWLTAKESEQLADEPIRWNSQLSKAFDADGEPLEASRLEYSWVSRFLETPVKDLFETTVHVGGARLGAFLSALDELVGRYKTEAVRNMTRQDTEVPPVYETIQLNSTLSRSFLIEGIRFLSGAAKMVLKVEPSWSGVAVTTYIARSGAEHAIDFRHFSELFGLGLCRAAGDDDARVRLLALEAADGLARLAHGFRRDVASIHDHGIVDTGDAGFAADHFRLGDVEAAAQRDELRSAQRSASAVKT